MYTLIINPCAGRGRGEKFYQAAAQALRAAGIAFTAHRTTAPGHAEHLVRDAAALGARDFVFICGDGTFHEGLQGLRGLDAANIALFPGGNGNDFAKTLGMPMDAQACVDVLVAGHKRVLDVGRAGTRLFANVMATGIDVDTLRALEKFAKYFRGMLSYLLSVLSAVIGFKHRHVRVRIDGGEWMEEKKVVLLAIANGSTFGGGMKVAPHAQADDGLLDVCFVSDIPKWRIPLLLPRFITGKHLTLKECKYFKASRVEIDADSPVLMEADGELVVSTPVETGIARERFSFYLPAPG